MTSVAGKNHRTNQAVQRLMNDINRNPIEDLILSNGTVYSVQYHCVEPVGGSWLDMESWCLDTYGSPGSVWTTGPAPKPDQRWYMNDRKFWFRDVKDRDWFILRWSA